MARPFSSDILRCRRRRGIVPSRRQNVYLQARDRNGIGDVYFDKLFSRRKARTVHQNLNSGWRSRVCAVNHWCALVIPAAPAKLCAFAVVRRIFGASDSINGQPDLPDAPFHLHEYICHSLGTLGRPQERYRRQIIEGLDWRSEPTKCFSFVTNNFLGAIN